MNPQTSQILSVFDKFRMSIIEEIDVYEKIGKAKLAARIDSMVSNNQPIKFYMLGLPFKSTNTLHKVLHDKPDMGEQLTMKQFGMFNQRVKSIYAPGVEIVVASDGYVFNHLLEVADKTVAEYREICLEYGAMYDSPVQIATLSDFYSGTLQDQRERVMKHFAPTGEEMQHKRLTDINTNMLYKGMIQFMGWELRMKEFVSNNQRQKAAKKLAREMMIHNEAYSALTRKEFDSTHIRLSMHHSDNSGKKYSFQLIEGENIHHSAWHSAIVQSASTGKVTTMHKYKAIEQGFELIQVNGRASHFIKE